MRPARKALRPASTAPPIASAIHYGVLSFGNRGVHKNAICSKFHRDGRIGSGSDACVDNQRHFRDALAAKICMFATF